MFRRPTRKATGWLAMATLALALAQPSAMQAGAFDPTGFDLCVGGKLVHGAPAGVPAPAAHDCDRCCGSVSAAPGPASLRPPVIRPAATQAALRPDGAPRLARGDLARARAPPAA